LATFKRRVPAAQAVDAAAIAALEPDLGERFRHGLFLPDEAHLDPRAALQHLHERLSTRQVMPQPAADLEGTVIDCRGLSAQAELGDLRGVKGEMVVVRSPDISLSRPVRLLHPRFPLYIVPRGGGVFMLGATQIESSARRHATLRSVMELLSAAYALHPAFGEAELLEIGVDARPAFPDNQPRIRQTAERIYANGLFRHGFLLSPALARMTADLVLEHKTPEDWYEDRR
ncbi:MAG: FAD-dependent oxidoreductase, partial [Pseudomonadota bacterium]